MTKENEQLTVATAMRQLVEWSESLPLPVWQQDALRRLYESCPLSTEDEEELLALLKHSHSLIESDEAPLTPVPLATGSLPASQDVSTSVTLKGIRNPTHVNALSPDQHLRFNDSGITIIFGNNGSGKSGYARILKSACRARSAEDILHNVYDSPPADRASATFVYKINGSDQPAFEWQSGADSHPDLSTVSVFDSKCAPIHVDERNEAAYVPAPLRILKELSDLCRKFKSTLQSELATLEASIPIGMRDLRCNHDTLAGKFLLEITENSSPEEADRLATLKEPELQRIEEIKLALSSDPLRIANQEAALNARLQPVIERVSTLSQRASDESLSSLRSVLITENSAVQAAGIAANRAFEDEPLAGVGSETWKTLWEAARAFSVKEAYIDQGFPYTDEARCVLCHQPLEEDAAKRLEAFESFVQDKTQEAADLARKETEAERKRLRDACISKEQAIQDVSLLKHELNKSELAVSLRRFYRECSIRLGRALQVEAAMEWPNLRSVSVDPIEDLKLELSRRQEQVLKLKAASDAKGRLALENELKELQDRVFLNSILDDAKSEIERLKQIKRIKSAINDTDTNRITRKSTELSDSLVTDAWRDRFAAEVSKLDIHHLRIELQREGGAYGAAKFRVALIRDNTVKLGMVLSEGEYRCIALAAFFAELATSDHGSSLVFDDPVSSLDHEHREAVAKRLSTEAASGRQIIVFTHDVYFLDLLSRNAREVSVPIKFLTVNRIPHGDNCGAIDDGVPSTVAPAVDLADGIRRQVKQFEGLYTSGRQVQWNAQTNSFSIQLRKCWERAVAEALAPVVERFSASVDTKNVWKIAALEVSDCISMREAYKRCSELNHEKCAELNRNDPTPADYYRELDAVVQWVEDVRKKQADAFDNRPKV